MNFITLNYPTWESKYGFPSFTINEEEIIFDILQIDGVTLSDVVLDNTTSVGINMNYQYNIFGNLLNLDIFKIDDFEMTIIFFDSDVNREPYPAKFPEGILICAKNMIKFYRVYTIYEMSTSYVGIQFGTTPLYFLKSEPEINININKFGKDTILNMFKMFKFDFALNSEMFINVHNSITSSFRKPGERNLLVPPIQI
jgi:hypothetical protein